MTRIISFLFVMIIICSTAAAQKHKPVKDTAAFLVSAFRSAWGEKKVSEQGKHLYTDRYTVTKFAVNNCMLMATVKMRNKTAAGGLGTYTLTYAIPLQDIFSIKIVRDTLRNGLQYQYKGAPVEFRVGTNSFAIKYTMTEDLTGRVEANAGYNESTLWFNPKKGKQVLEVLHALWKRCQ